jgi:hypothetical protein
MFAIPDGSQSNGYQKRGRKPGRKTDFINDPIVNARRAQVLAQMAAASTQQSDPNETPALTIAGIAGGGTSTTKNGFNAAAKAMLAGHTSERQVLQQQKSFKRQKISECWAIQATCELGAASLTPALERQVHISGEYIELIVCEPIDRSLTAVHKFAQGEKDTAGPELTKQQCEDYRSNLLSMDAIADQTLIKLRCSRVADIALTTQLLHEPKALVRNALIPHCGGLHEAIQARMTAHWSIIIRVAGGSMEMAFETSPGRS